MPSDPSPSSILSNLEELNKFLDNNFWDITANLHQGDTSLSYDPDVRHQVVLLHTSRCYKAGLKIIHEEHGPDADEVARRALNWVKERYEREVKEDVDYYSSLLDHVNRNYTDAVTVIVRDRDARAPIPGSRFRAIVQLKSGSSEHASCGDWVFAEGFGRDSKQASRFALETLELKERKQLLWINEKINDNISYFNSKQLKSLQKQIKDKKILIPNCLKSGGKILVEPEPKKNESTLSMKTLWNRSPFSSPTKEKKRILSQSDSAGGPSRDSSARGQASLLSKIRRGPKDASRTSESATPIKRPDTDKDNKENGGLEMKATEKRGAKLQTGNSQANKSRQQR